MRERVRCNVGVRMAAKAGRMLDFDTTKYELSAFLKRMEIKPLSNFETHQRFEPRSRRRPSQVDKLAATIQARIRYIGGQDTHEATRTLAKPKAERAIRNLSM